MTKTTITIVAVTSGILFIFYLGRFLKSGNNTDLNIFNNEPLFASDENNQRETIIGGSRKRKKIKSCSKKNKNN